MKIALKDNIYYIDKNCNIPTKELMKRSGEAVGFFIKKNINDNENKKIAVFCGHGNNGGDAFAFVDIYHNQFNILNPIIFLGDETKITEDCKYYLSNVENYINITKNPDLEFINNTLKNCDIVIDGIFGIGYKYKKNDYYDNIFKLINNSNKIIISIDIPSGITDDGTNFNPDCIKANYTVSLCLPKLSYFEKKTKEFIGNWEIYSLGIDNSFLNNKNIKINLIDEKIIHNIYKKRNKSLHKGNFGHLLNISGSIGMIGACYFSSLSALKVGVGLETVFTHNKNLPVIQSLLPEAMCSGYSYKSILEKFDYLINNQKFNVILFGCGIPVESFYEKLLMKILTQNRINNIVLDAGAIKLLKGKKIKEYTHSKNIILTPHIGEMAYLTNTSIDHILESKYKFLLEFVNQNKVNIILKDSVSFIANSEGEIYINNLETSALAKGGSGDILAGMISSFLASGYNSLESMILASYILSKCGIKYENNYPPETSLAKDIISFIPDIIKEINSLSTKPENIIE